MNIETQNNRKLLQKPITMTRDLMLNVPLSQNMYCTKIHKSTKQQKSLHYPTTQTVMMGLGFCQKLQ